MFRKVMLLGVVAIVVVVTSGCYARARVRPAYATVSTGHATTGTVVYEAPPAPRVVVTNPPPAPYSGAVWVQGHWSWNGAQYVWVEGRYIQPRVGYSWVQPRWERRGNGWVHVQGSWAPARGHVHVRNRGHVNVRPARGRVHVQQPRGHVHVQSRGGVQVQPARVQPRRDTRVRVRGNHRGNVRGRGNVGVRGSVQVR